MPFLLFKCFFGCCLRTNVFCVWKFVMGYISASRQNMSYFPPEASKRFFDRPKRSKLQKGPDELIFFSGLLQQILSANNILAYPCRWVSCYFTKPRRSDLGA